VYERTTARLVERNCLAHRLFSTDLNALPAEDRDASGDGRDAA
jgi:hypothetical protein